METNLNITGNNTDFHINKAKLAKFAKLSEMSENGGLDVKKRAKIAKAARGFESMFVNMMLKEMKSAMLPKVESKDKMGTFGADTLQGYTDVLWSEEIANTGQGIGIAQMIYKQLTGGERLSNKTQTYDFKNNSKNADANKIQIDDISQNTISQNFDTKTIENIKSKLSNYDKIINDAAKTYDISPSLIKSIISVESSANPNALSSSGAKGLMQLMDGTSKELGIKNSYNPLENIKGGTEYIKKMLDSYGGNLETALAAYNAGPGNVDKYNGIPPFSETEKYIEKVKMYNSIFEKD